MLRYGGDRLVLQPSSDISFTLAPNAEATDVPPPRYKGLRDSWRRVVAAASEAKALRLVVLGTSITAGCKDAPGADNLATNSTGCDLQSSWGRFLQDGLSSLCVGDACATVSIWATPAVLPKHFEVCGHRYDVNAGAHIVLLEFQAVLQVFPCEVVPNQLRGLVNNIRRNAPHAAIVFVGWPARKEDSMRFLCPPKDIDHLLREFCGFYDIDLVSLIRSTDRPSIWIPTDYTDPAARKQYGGNHPTSAGSLFMARETQKLVTARIRAACCNEHPGETNGSFLPASGPPAPFEWCPMRGGMVPIMGSNSSWRLVDEGDEGGVRKTGWLSSTPDVNADGLVLDIGPIIKPICAVLEARLGYVESWKAEYGALHVRCSGDCDCYARDFGHPNEKDWMAFAHSHPFPRVETWNRRASATISAGTTFLVVPDRHIYHPNISYSSAYGGPRIGKGCRVQINHVSSQLSRGALPLASDQSHVRVDSFTLQVAEEYQQCSWTCMALHRQHSNRMANYARSCAFRAAHGEVNASGPACMQKANNVYEGTAVCTHIAAIEANATRATAARANATRANATRATATRAAIGTRTRANATRANGTHANATSAHGNFNIFNVFSIFQPRVTR